MNECLWGVKSEAKNVKIKKIQPQGKFAGNQVAPPLFTVAFSYFFLFFLLTNFVRSYLEKKPLFRMP